MKKIKGGFVYVETDEEFKALQKSHFKLIHQQVVMADALTLLPLVAYLVKNSRLDVRQHYKKLSLQDLAEIELLNRFPLMRRRKK